MATKITGTVGGEPTIQVEIGGVFYPWKQGVSNWSTVTATTGTPATGTYTDSDGTSWKWYRWTGSGSVTLTAGIIDVLLVGGGGGSYPALGTVPGVGAYVVSGIRSFTAATHTVTVGAGGASANDATNAGGQSVLGSLKTGASGPGRGTPGDQSSLGNSNFTPIYSSITGSSVAYSGSKGYLSTAYGGAANSTTDTGQAGVVIFRVPLQFAQA